MRAFGGILLAIVQISINSFFKKSEREISISKKRKIGFTRSYKFIGRRQKRLK